MGRKVKPVRPVRPVRSGARTIESKSALNGVNGLNRHNRLNRLNGFGQVMIEFAVSLTGLVMFIYVFLKTWGWLSGMIVHRQSYFQATRLAAGKVATAGKEVGYTREPLTLVGVAGSSGGDGLGIPSIPVPLPPCLAAKPFYDDAKVHLDQAAAYREQAKPWLDDMQTLSAEARTIQTRLDAIDARLAQVNQDIADLEAACRNN